MVESWLRTISYIKDVTVLTVLNFVLELALFLKYIFVIFLSFKIA